MAFNMATLSREQKTCGFNLFNLQGNLDISLLQSHGCVFLLSNSRPFTGGKECASNIAVCLLTFSSLIAHKMTHQVARNISKNCLTIPEFD